MLESLPTVLEIQELDMKMMRLMRVKNERRHELERIQQETDLLQHKVAGKEEQMADTRRSLRLLEAQIAEVVSRIEKAETRQNSLKKVEEFNAVTQEINTAQREKTRLEAQASEMTDKLVAEEEILGQLKKEFKEIEENSKALKKELSGSIQEINNEGVVLQKEREGLATKASPDLMEIYERLLHNKKDRVIVAIENRTCSGCHIVLTAQHENLVRRGERPIFCEHCARLHYWKEGTEEEASTSKRRRKKS